MTQKIYEKYLHIDNGGYIFTVFIQSKTEFMLAVSNNFYGYAQNITRFQLNREALQKLGDFFLNYQTTSNTDVMLFSKEGSSIEWLAGSPDSGSELIFKTPQADMVLYHLDRAYHNKKQDFDELGKELARLATVPSESYLTHPDRYIREAVK